MNRRPKRGRHIDAGRHVLLAGRAIARSSAKGSVTVIAPTLEGKDVEFTVIVKRKAEYKKPAFV